MVRSPKWPGRIRFFQTKSYSFCKRSKRTSYESNKDKLEKSFNKNKSLFLRNKLRKSMRSSASSPATKTSKNSLLQTNKLTWKILLVRKSLSLRKPKTRWTRTPSKVTSANKVNEMKKWMKYSKNRLDASRRQCRNNKTI